ncbi:hypothetical protein DXV76_16095 [Rhodobacteraceae bacterium CCMM004]|nr:hypothetical protein DXV76_16095 [Rhodobacteraceae bacterium CCMM004]
MRRSDPPTGTGTVLTGLTLLIFGAVLERVRPAALDLPTAREDSLPADAGRVSRYARRTRDELEVILPDNLSDAFGRSFVFLGAGLIALRLLDLLSDPRSE